MHDVGSAVGDVVSYMGGVGGVSDESDASAVRTAVEVTGKRVTCASGQCGNEGDSRERTGRPAWRDGEVGGRASSRNRVCVCGWVGGTSSLPLSGLATRASMLLRDSDGMTSPADSKRAIIVSTNHTLSGANLSASCTMRGARSLRRYLVKQAQHWLVGWSVRSFAALTRVCVCVCVWGYARVDAALEVRHELLCDDDDVGGVCHLAQQLKCLSLEGLVGVVEAVDHHHLVLCSVPKATSGGMDGACE
jgi:hypothetical protein